MQMEFVDYISTLDVAKINEKLFPKWLKKNGYEPTLPNILLLANAYISWLSEIMEGVKC